MPLSPAEQREMNQLIAYLDESGGDIDYTKYAKDAAGFIEEVLGELLTDDLREICESVVEYPVTIAQSGNGTGKSWISSRLAVWFFKCQYEPQVYGAAAPPESNLRNILWSEVGVIKDKFPDLFAGYRVKDLRIERSSKQFMTGVTIPTAGTDKEKEGRFSGKHAPSMLFVVDEADAVPDPVFAGIDTCLSGGFERLLCMFNPRQRLGHVYRTIKKGRANVIRLSAFNHPNVITGNDVIPGAVSREKTLRRIAEWTRPLSPTEVKDKRCFELPDFLVGCIPTNNSGDPYPALVAGTYKIIEHQFSHVVLGEYPAQAENQLISEEWVDDAQRRYNTYVAKHGLTQSGSIRCKCGLDIADMGQDSSVLTKRFDTFVHPLVAWQKQDVSDVGDLVALDLQTSGIHDVSAVNCDGTGVGAGVAGYLQKTHYLTAVKVMVASKSTEKTELGEFGLLLDELMWKVREWLRTELAMLPPDDDLVEELLAFTYEIRLGKVKVSSTDDVKTLIGRSPDRVRSLMLSFHDGGMFSGADLS